MQKLVVAMFAILFSIPAVAKVSDRPLSSSRGSAEAYTLVGGNYVALTIRGEAARKLFENIGTQDVEQGEDGDGVQFEQRYGGSLACFKFTSSVTGSLIRNLEYKCEIFMEPQTGKINEPPRG